MRHLKSVLVRMCLERQHVFMSRVVYLELIIRRHVVGCYSMGSLTRRFAVLVHD